MFFKLAEWESKPSHPLLGNTAMARGSSKLLLIRTLRHVPSRRATSMVLRPVSVQYMFLATQSTANPSVVFKPWLITVSMPLPSRFARLVQKTSRFLRKYALYNK